MKNITLYLKINLILLKTSKMEHIQPYILMKLASSSNEGNSVYMTIMIVLLLVFVKLCPLNEIKEQIINYFNNSNYYYISIPSYEVPIVRTYSQVSITKIIYSNRFLSIIHYLNNNELYNIQSLTEMMALNGEINPNHDGDKKMNNDSKYLLIPSCNVKFKIRGEIFFEIQDSSKKDEDEADNNKGNKTPKAIKHKNLVISLSILKSDISNIKILTDFIDDCESEYNNYIMKSLDDNKQYIYEYKESEKSESTLELRFSEYLSEHNKDLDVNIFFEGKQALCSYVSQFIYDPIQKVSLYEDKYKRAGYTYKAGMLFHGNPGCGKTSTIKAILKKTKRHGIVINLAKIKTCEELQDIFRKRKINNKTFTGNQLCYILEDCDAFDDNIIKKRESKDSSKDKSKLEENDQLLGLSKLLEMKSDRPTNISNDLVNLSCFLNILDGIIELHGIMIIMTTNHPEKIDPALIRPGRIDFIYEFKKASNNIIKEMIKFKFELSDEDMIKYKDIIFKNEVLSPAEVQSLCFKTDDITHCIDSILHEISVR